MTRKEMIMKATGKWLLVTVLMLAAGGQVWAETGKPGERVAEMKTAGWERVGDAGNLNQALAGQRAQAPGEGRLNARKSDMVRRMFWIMLAHR
jgi:hypothetical protein